MREPADQRELANALRIDIDPELLRRALTHRSYAYEHGGLPHNERLEFLGDAVLELATTNFLFTKFPTKPEGEQTVDVLYYADDPNVARVFSTTPLSISGSVWSLFWGVLFLRSQLAAGVLVSGLCRPNEKVELPAARCART